MEPIGANFNGMEWIWREFLKDGQTTLTRKFPNKFFLTAQERKRRNQASIEGILMEEDELVESCSCDDPTRNGTER